MQLPLFILEAVLIYCAGVALLYGLAACFGRRPLREGGRLLVLLWPAALPLAVTYIASSAAQVALWRIHRKWGRMPPQTAKVKNR